MQAPRFERLSFEPFSLFQNGFVTPEVDIGGCDVVQALVVTLMIAMIDEGLNLGFEVTRQDVVFQQNAVLEGLMPTLNLALRLGMVRGTQNQGGKRSRHHCRDTRFPGVKYEVTENRA
jgi:hypothetical protein